MPAPNKDRLPLESTLNTRDLGGYRHETGVTAPTFLRSDYLRPLSAADVLNLKAIGLQSVVDLRTPKELVDLPSTFAALSTVEYYHRPVFDDEGTKALGKALAAGQGMGGFYVDLMESCGPGLLGVFQTLAAAPGRTLFHCSAGKDRTGVVAALLLDLVGVESETIIADYVLTEVFLGDSLKSHVSALGQDQAAQDEILGAKPQTVRHFLNHLQREYGGATTYLASLGLTGRELQLLKRKMVEGVSA